MEKNSKMDVQFISVSSSQPSLFPSSLCPRAFTQHLRCFPDFSQQELRGFFLFSHHELNPT